MSALIGALRVSLSAETAQFEAGMKRAQRTAHSTRSQFQKSFGGLGNIVKAGFAGAIAGLSIGLITQGVKAALDYAGSLGEVSQQLGVTTRDLQVFRYAAGQAGVSQEEMDKGLARLTKSMGDAQAGSKTMIAAFGAIGISIDDIRGKDAGEVFRMMADGLAKIPDAAQRAAVETAIFGRAGQKLDTLLAGGSDAVNELALAAEQLGIVLSDEQIQKADETADKLEAIKTVMSARIAGVVADNADAILGLANALGSIVAVAGKVVNAMARVGEAVSRIPQPPAWVMALGAGPGGATGFLFGSAVGQGKKLGSSATVSLPPARRKVTPSAGIGNFLAPSGGGKSKRGGDDAARKAAEERRRLAQVAQESLRAEIDILNAKKDLAHDYSERYAISIQVLDLEKQGYEAELADRVTDGDLKAVEAKRLKLKNDEIHALEVQALQQEEEEQRQRDYNMLEAKDFDLKRDILERQAGLAETASERRAVELKILDLAYREERERLERITRESKDWAEIEAARRDLLALSQKQQLDRQGVMQQTRGPLEAYTSGLPLDPAKLNEALENVAVNGLQSLEDGLMSVIDGTKSVGEAFKEMAKSIIADLLRIAIRRAIIGPLANMLFGGAGGGMGGGMAPGLGGGVFPGWTSADGLVTLTSVPGFATGGGFNVMGNRGVDRNMLQLNGLPIARVSHGERVSISNDNQRMAGNTTVNFALSGPVSRETMGQIAAKTKLVIASANRKGM